LPVNWGYLRTQYCNEAHGTSIVYTTITSCIETGVGYINCSICGYIEGLTPALGHNVEEWTIDVESTCISEGSRYGSCARCGEIVTEAIAKIPHNYVNKVCTVCGEEQPFTITFSSTYPFAYDSSTGYWKSGNKGVNSSTSQMKITALGNITVSFSYKASSESGWDKFTIIHNGTTKVTSSGNNTSFTSYSIDLSAGDVLTLQYYKDSSSHSYDDTVYIQNLTIGSNIITSDNVSFRGGGAMVGQLMAYSVSVAQIDEPKDTVIAYIEQEKKYLAGAVINKELFT
jgi:hypothetical protein